MGSMGSIGSVSAKFEASTGDFTASMTGVHESLGKTAAKAKEAGAQVKAALGEMTIAAQKAKFAALTASDATVSGLGKTTAAHERAVRAWQREKLAQDRAADTAQAVARANELAALKADILARANEKLGLSANSVVASFQLMGREVRESLDGVGEKIAATAERAELSADGIASAFGGLGKLIGVGIAGDMAAHMLDNLAELNVRLGDLHEKTGIAVQDLAGLRLAALSKGLDFETIGTGLTRLGRAMFEAKEGMLEDREAFSALGISMQEVNTLSVEQMFYRISKAIGENKSLALQDGTALELFGRGGKELIPVLREWGGNLHEIVDEQAKLTRMTPQSVAASQKWLEATTDLSAEFHGALTPVLVSLVKHMGGFEAAGRVMMMVTDGIGLSIAASVATITDAYSGLAKALDDIVHGRFSAALADDAAAHARALDAWKTVVQVEKGDFKAMVADWKSSGMLPPTVDEPDVNRYGDADGALLKAAKQDLANRERKHALTQKQLIAFWQSYLAKAKPGSTDYEQINIQLGNVMQRAGRGAASAAKAQMEAFEQGLSDLKNAHRVSVAEEYDYWAKKLATLRSGSANYLKVAREMGTLWQQILKGQDAVNKQYASGSMMLLPAQFVGLYGQRTTPPAALPYTPQSAMNGEVVRQIHGESMEQVRNLENLKRGAEARQTLADRAAESAVKLAQARGEMSKLDAAEVLAALHAETYSRKLNALYDSLDAIAEMKGLRPEDRNAQMSVLRDQIDMLSGARGGQIIEDNAAIHDATLGGSVRRAFDLYVQQARDTADQISEIMTGAFDSVNDSLSRSLMAHAYNGREYRRNIEQGLSNTARGIGSQVLNAGLHQMEGGLLSKLGFGPKGKLGETESTAMWVRMAGSMERARSSIGSIFPNGFDLGSGGGSGSSGSGVSGLFSSILSMVPGFADGGVIPSNAWSIVGERGMELLPPVGHPRTVIPNDKIGGFGGGGDMHFHVDARGSHDPAAVEAAVQRGIRAAAPHIMRGAAQVVHENRVRRPSMAR